MGLDAQVRRTLLWLALAAVAVYAPLIGWGLPDATSPARIRTYAVDELLPLDPLAEMHNTFVVSKPDRNYGYPWWHYFTLASAQAPYLLYAKLTGQFKDPSPVYPYGFKDPIAGLQGLTLAGRLASVLMGAGIVLLTYAFGRTLWDQRTGVLAALMTMLAYPQVYYSRVGNPDVGLVFWSAIGLLAFALILRHGLTAQRAAWLGVAAGLAMGTKDQGLVVFLPLGVALLFPRLNADPQGRYQWRPLALGLACSIASYAVATGMLVDPKRHFLHVYYLFFAPSEVTWMPFYHPALPRTWPGVVAMARETLAGLVAMASLPVLLAAAAGALVAWSHARRYLVLLLPLPTLFVILTLPTGTVGYRYLYPLLPLLAAFAAAFVSWLGTRYSRVAMTVLATALIGWQAAVALDLSYAQARETRLSAAEWFGDHLRPGDRIEFFGVEQYLPPLPADATPRRIAGRENWKRETGHGPYLVDYLRRDGPRFVYVTPDHSSRPGMIVSGDMPPEVFAALNDGSAGYRLAAYFPTPTILPAPLGRPRLDYPAVSPPVRIYERIGDARNPPASPATTGESPK